MVDHLLDICFFRLKRRKEKILLAERAREAHDAAVYLRRRAHAVRTHMNTGGKSTIGNHNDS